MITHTNELQSLINRWIQWMKAEKHYSDNTIEAYITDLSMFLVFLREYLNTRIFVSRLQDITCQNVRA